ncbi:MAG: aminotransferase class IV [Thermodesulfobacteriota bacterium]
MTIKLSSSNHKKRDSFKVYINGRYVSWNRASISIFDRGLKYGDGIFETMKSYNGRVFTMNRHLVRLNRSIRAIGIIFKGLGDIKTIIDKLLRLNKLDREEAYIRLTITRGIDPGGLLPSRNLKPSIIITAKPVDSKKISRLQKKGIKACFFDSESTSMHSLKTLNFLPYVLAKIAAAKEGAAEGLMTYNGFVAEGASSNLFTVVDRCLKTPPLDGNILPGITREIIIELGRKEGLTCIETPVTIEKLLSSEEVFISNSISEVVPVTRIGDKIIGSGKRGVVTYRLQELYRGLVSDNASR